MEDQVTQTTEVELLENIAEDTVTDVEIKLKQDHLLIMFLVGINSIDANGKK